MKLTRIKELRTYLEDECIDLTELSEIHEEFNKIPVDELRDLPENAMAEDELDELEDRVSPMEKAIYDWVEENFGESEAKDPSWDIHALAEHLNSLSEGGQK